MSFSQNKVPCVKQMFYLKDKTTKQKEISKFKVDVNFIIFGKFDIMFEIAH